MIYLLIVTLYSSTHQFPPHTQTVGRYSSEQLCLRVLEELQTATEIYAQCVPMSGPGTPFWPEFEDRTFLIAKWREIAADGGLTAP
jgi:hypothetical protein